jgi:hypothetical protein
MLLIAALALAIVWVSVIVVVVGLCRDAARGDRALSHRRQRGARAARMRVVA